MTHPFPPPARHRLCLKVRVLLLAFVLAFLVPRGASAKDPAAPTYEFSGRLDRLDLTHHPMRLFASLGKGRPLYFLFGGTLIPDTMVYSKGRAVGVTALKEGQTLKIFYRSTSDGPEILRIVLGPFVKGKSRPQSSSTPSRATE